MTTRGSTTKVNLHFSPTFSKAAIIHCCLPKGWNKRRKRKTRQQRIQHARIPKMTVKTVKRQTAPRWIPPWKKIYKLPV